MQKSENHKKLKESNFSDRHQKITKYQFAKFSKNNQI